MTTTIVSKMEKVIKIVGEELGLKVTESSDYEFEIEDIRYHTVAWKVYRNAESYLQIHVWQDTADRYSKHKEKKAPKVLDKYEYSRAIMSLRTMNDAVKFCMIMTTAMEVRAGR